MKTLRNILPLFLLLSISCGSSCDSNSNDGKHVIILSLDAFRWDLASRAHTPTLDSLKLAGTYSDISPVYPSNTFPSHFSMATGLHPNNHGLVNNGYYDKKINKLISGLNPEHRKIEGFWEENSEPIWNTVERQDNLAHVYMWVGSEEPINGRQASVWTPYSSTPTYYERADWVVDAMMKPAAECPNLVMWYFEQPDKDMHKYGPTSQEAIKQAEYIDKVLTYFFYKIRQSPIYDKINFIITADHGMTDVSADRYINYYSKLDNSKIIGNVNGNPLGIEVDNDYIDTAIDIINDNGNATAYRREDMPKKFNYGSHPTRLSNVIVVPEIGWTLSYSPKDYDKFSKGSHGYDSTNKDMHMIFYASGPAFKANYIQESFQNHNMYLILCNVLDVEPAKNDGKWDDIKSMFK